MTVQTSTTYQGETRVMIRSKLEPSRSISVFFKTRQDAAELLKVLRKRIL